MDSKRQLLFSVTKKDLNLSYFSGSGAGGQHRNRHLNCVRLNHPESGAMVTGQSHKEKKANIQEAFNNLTNHYKFKLWHNAKVNEALHGESIKDKVEKMMSAENLKIEYKEGNQWRSKQCQYQ